MLHSCLYPCTFCLANKNKLRDRAQLRTIGSTLENYSNWKASGAKKNDAKSFGNCIQKPVFTGDSNQVILDIIPPPELHLMLGVVNIIFERMLKEFNKEALEWAKSCNVERDVTYGGTNFNGNSCKRLLDKIDVLRTKCPIGCMRFVKCFDDFRAVVKACFGNQLHPEFVDKIDSFKQSYLDLNIPDTPKVHGGILPHY